MWLLTNNVSIAIFVSGLIFILVLIYFYIDEKKEKQKNKQQKERTLLERIPIYVFIALIIIGFLLMTNSRIPNPNSSVNYLVYLDTIKGASGFILSSIGVFGLLRFLLKTKK